jgi:hypothetical protein
MKYLSSQAGRFGDVNQEWMLKMNETSKICTIPHQNYCRDVKFQSKDEFPSFFFLNCPEIFFLNCVF